MSDTKIYTLRAIAGYSNEPGIWRMVRDLTAAMGETGPRAVDADTVEIDEHGDFRIAIGVAECSDAEAVWAIGELVSYLSSGRRPFGGRGASYRREHPRLPLPSLRREHSSLTPLVHACLVAEPTKRPSLEQLTAIARTGWRDVTERLQRRPVVDREGDSPATDDSIEALWPDKFSQ